LNFWFKPSELLANGLLQIVSRLILPGTSQWFH
jgi:hypothetical protein